MRVDVAIVGGGPAGLALATSLGGSGLAVAVIEQQPEAALAEAGFDGREIALTYHSQAILKVLGAKGVAVALCAPTGRAGSAAR